VPALLGIAEENDAELAQAALAALAALPGEAVNSAIVERLSAAQGKLLAVLIDVVGRRRIAAPEALVKAVDHSDPEIRRAALTALGETIGPTELPVLIAQVLQPRNAADAEVAQRALLAPGRPGLQEARVSHRR
jgi:HEAT repeat protein